MNYLKEKEIEELKDVSYKIRRLALEMITYANWGHIGGSFSCAEILACLYFHFLKTNPQNPKDENRDYFILSKAHASPALYATLVLKGFLQPDKIYTYCLLDGLDGHTSIECPGIDYSGGSLGLGLSYAVGIALGLKMKEKIHQRVYCLLGDGELNEGNIWEAALLGAHYKLDNLIVIIDYNKVSAKGFINEIMSIEPLIDKWEAFGWKTIEIDGHNINEIYSALYKARYIEVRGKPICIIAHTVKGKGIEECEFNYKWHGGSPDIEKAEMFLKELAQRYNKPYKDFKMLPLRKDNDSLRAVLG